MPILTYWLLSVSLFVTMSFIIAELCRMSHGSDAAEARTLVLEMTVAALIGQQTQSVREEVVAMLAYVAGLSGDAEALISSDDAPIVHCRHWATEMLARVMASRKASRQCLMDDDATQAPAAGKTEGSECGYNNLELTLSSDIMQALDSSRAWQAEPQSPSDAIRCLINFEVETARGTRVTVAGRKPCPDKATSWPSAPGWVINPEPDIVDEAVSTATSIGVEDTG